MGGGGGSSTSLDYRSNSVGVITGGTYVPFSPPLAGAFTFGILRCYDSSGNSIGCRITSLSGSGFTAFPVRNGTLEYFAVPRK